MSYLRLALPLFRTTVSHSQQIVHHLTPTTSSRFLASGPFRPRKKSQKLKKFAPAHSPGDDFDGFGSVSHLPRPERMSRNEQTRFFPRPEECEFPSIELTPAENEIGIAMLKRVVEALDANGHKFLMPWNDDYAIEKILGVLREITSTTGMKVEFLVDAFVQKPKLFTALTNHGDKSVEILDTLSDVCGFAIQDSLRVLASFTDELLETSSQEIQERLSIFIQTGIQGGYPVGQVVRKCPAVLFAGNAHQMAQTVENMSEFFSRNETKQVLERVPQVTLMSFDDVESKYEYIYYQMGFEPGEFVTCTNWPLKSLEEIMDRHQLLVKTGRYTHPDPKKPQLKMENPLLYRILDTRDDNFATQVARVTLDEWLVYKEVAKKLRNLENKERPFERIKPSMRKAYERRMKENPEPSDFVFE